ncbi:MAG: HlyC/CorC family transporter [Candidatus Omnitrophica bacterium]|nr:HlyC/CorC family transporter [Candidatus Omnitrophota bacterium]
MYIPFVLILLFVFIILSFFFSASETSIIGLSKIRLRHMIQKGVKNAGKVENLLIKVDKVIAAILIGNNIVNIAISALVTGIFVQAFGYRWGVIFSTFITTFTVLIFCEVTPKILASKHAEKVALFTAPIMGVVIKILNPLIVFFIGISNFILKIFRMPQTKRSPLITEEELRTIIEIGAEEGILDQEEKKMLQRIFEFGNTRAGDVMVPLDKITAVSSQASHEELLNVFVEEGHARLPVYKDKLENIIGIVHGRDLLYILRDNGLFLLQDLIREAAFVPKKMCVNEVLKKFQAEKIQIAIVTDEHKKAVGLVTLEDLIEEIVGEIEEKHIRRSSNKV